MSNGEIIDEEKSRFALAAILILVVAVSVFAAVVSYSLSGSQAVGLTSWAANLAK